MAMNTESKTVEVDDGIVVQSGLLRKKGRYSPKWKLVFVRVESCFLKYGPSEQSQLKKINLVGSVIEDWDEKGTQYIFSVQSRESMRKYIFCAENAEEHSKWLQAVCLARLSNQPRSGNSEACVIQ